MEARQSRTRIFYQATPAVGADGRNIMKLIPVKIVNGQKSSVPVTKAGSVTQFVSQEFSRGTVSAANFVPSQMHSARLDSVNKRPPQAAPPTRPSHQLPVMVKSPALPRGQFLKIPPNAQVQRVPVSQLPPLIKDQIFTSSSCSSTPTVVYVSPVTTMSQAVSEPSRINPTPSLKLPSNSDLPRGAEPHLKLVPKVSDRPNSPIRWEIEEVEGCAAETPTPLRSPPGAPRDAGGTENALVMYNGRVFFVAQNNGLSSAAPPSRHPAVTQTGQNLRVQDYSNNVIDLCDDDEEPAPSSNTSPVSHQDEDNVIFVSYIPPRSESDTRKMGQAAARRSTRRADGPVLRGGGLGQNTSISKVTDVYDPTEINVSNRPSQFSISDLQLDSMEVDSETGCPPGHLVRDTETGCPPGHLVRDTETGCPPGHLVRDTETGCPPGHLVMDTETGCPPGHLVMDTETGCPSGHLVRDAETGRPPGHLVRDTETGRVPGHVMDTETGRVPGHVMDTETGRLPGHVMDTETGRVPGHVMDTGTGRVPGHVMDTETGRVPGHVMDTETGRVPGHVMYTGTGRVPGHVMDTETGRVPGHVMDTETGRVPGHVMDTGTGRVPGHVMDTETGRVPGHVMYTGTGRVPGHVMDTGTGRVPGHVMDTETGRVPGHVMYTGTGRPAAQTQQNSRLPAPHWTSLPAPEPEPCQRSDQQLRRIFGITSEVKVFLQKLDEAAAGRLLEDDRKPTKRLKENKTTPEKFTGTDHELSASLHARAEPLDHLNFHPKPQESCWSGQSSAVIGYVEPIDEDFPGESDKSEGTAHHLQTQTGVDASRKTRRVGRTRRRTMCPCCIPAALHPVLKSGVSLEELEAWMFITEQTEKRVARAKTSRKHGRTSVKISYQNCQIHEATGLSSTSTDKFRGHEQKGRLKGLQGEKET